MVRTIEKHFISLEKEYVSQHLRSPQCKVYLRLPIVVERKFPKHDNLWQFLVAPVVGLKLNRRKKNRRHAFNL